MPMQPHKLITLSPINLLLFFLLLLLPPLAKPDLISERASLLTLRAAVGGRTLLWDTTYATPCNWAGVKCDQNNTYVVELHLPGVALSGVLPAGVFSNLPNLRTLSLRFNTLSGPLPTDLAACSALRNLYLQQNLLSGEIPAFLFRLTGLVRLNLASNNFSGHIPVGFRNLTRLRTLLLQNNRFTGSLPELDRGDLAQFNVSNNMLNGSVPEKLQTFGKDSFLGNFLCGKPLGPCPGDAANSGNGANGNGNSSVVGVNEGLKKKGKLSGAAIAGIVIGSVVVLLLVVFALIILCKNKSGEKTRTSSVDDVAATVKHGGVGIRGDDVETSGNGYSAAAAAVAGNGGRGEGVGPVGVGGGDKKLVFFGNWGKVFDLEDLLRASAEVLGKGTFGTSYKAVLEVGPVVAVKRLKDVTISEREFKEKIEGVGAMDYENLVPLRAYYYSRDEKLLVHDYLPMGSLSALLHGEGYFWISSASFLPADGYVF